MNLNSPIYSTLLPNKFLIMGLILCIWDFGRSRDQNGSGGSIYTGSLPCSAPTRMDMPGDGDEVIYDRKRVDVFHFTSLWNVIIVVEFKIYSS